MNKLTRMLLALLTLVLCGCQLTAAMYVEKNFAVDNNPLHDVKSRAEIRVTK